MIRSNKFTNVRFGVLLLVSILALNNICLGDFDSDFIEFQQAVNNGKVAESMSKGESIFKELETEYYNNPGFNSLKSKLTASIFLAKKMNSNLSEARKKAMANQMGSGKKSQLTVPPARTYYESAKKLFSKGITAEGIVRDHKFFLGMYYNFRLRVLTTALAKSGQGLSIADPSFKGTYEYVLVLPLLHCLNGSPLDFDTLPALMKKKNNAQALSEACLKHFGLPYQAMNISKSIAEENNSGFNEYNYYISAAKTCEKQMPGVAVDCLSRAIHTLGDKKNIKFIDMSFEIIRIWLDSGKYSLAAGYAKDLSGDIRGNKRYPEAVWNYYYALSRTNNVEAILSSIDSALNDETCSKYHAKLAYIKWWSLRRSRADAEQIMALEKKLMEMYPDNPMLAPIYLSRATDLLARQNYKEAMILLDKIVKKYPGSKAAVQAKKILVKLNRVLNRGT